MPKARMTAFDVRAMVSSLKPAVLRLRVANIYDISSKVYVLKLSESDESQKRYLLIEAGTRFHLSDWKRDKQSIPSVFTMKLRKLIRTKRLSDISQVGADRVVDIQFGYNENAIHLVVEFYARGNVVLTDHTYNVIASWRQFKSDQGLSVKVKSQYPIHEYLKSSTLTSYPISCLDDEAGDFEQLRKAATDAFIKSKENLAEEEPQKKGKNSRSQHPSVKLFDILSRMNPASHAGLVQQAALQSGVDASKEIIDDASVLDINIVRKICQCILQAWNSISDDGSTILGYLYSKPSAEGSPKRETFSPKPLVSRDPSWIEDQYPTFYNAVDLYFTEADLARDEKAQGSKTQELETKVEKIKQDQYDRVDKLVAERNTAEQCALRVEHYVDFIGQLLEMVQRLVKSGSDWKSIENAIKEQRRNGHPLASYIQSISLKDGEVTVLLPHPDIGLELKNVEEFGMVNPIIAVPLVISENAFANVKRLHSNKKACELKCEKTKAAAKLVIDKAEKSVQQEQARRQVATQQRPAIQRVRPVFWFEKFYWFISSDRYLVIAGKDALQNEILYRKYLTKHDLYVHADVHGAATCIIRNPGGGIVPESTINEAGTMAVCRSNAWKNKVLANAFWVHAHQVSKTPQAGEYVTTGGFIIRGKRNLIIVKKLEVGVGILFHLGDDDSIARHLDPQAQNDEEMKSTARCEHPNSATTSLPEDQPGTAPLTTPPGLTEERRMSVQSRRSSLKSSGSRVQFGSFEILPTTSIEAKVDFADLPPEVILVQPDKSILSEEEGKVDQSDCEDDSDEAVSASSGHHGGGSSILRRPDSADELPPPSDYAGRSSPKDLLAKRTPETGVLSSPDSCGAPSSSEPSSPDRNIHIRSDSSSLATRDPVDGGPMPRGFLSQELPAPKELLRSGSSSVRRMSVLSIPENKALDEEAEITPEASNSEKPSVVASPSKKKEKPLSKHQREKLKKVKKRYGEQSDDEREEAMKLIGASRMKHEINSDDDRTDLEKTKKTSNYPEKTSKTPIEDRHLDSEESDRDDEEWKKRLQVLDELTGKPFDNDLITLAIPVCAPYAAISKYLYKGRLLPGGGKKGQAVQLTHKAFMELTPPASIQRQLIRGITADEFSAVMVSSPVVQIEGADRIQKKEKKAQKTLKKALKAK